MEGVILQHILMIDIWGISSKNGLRWIPQDFADDKWTLVQVMACCCQATSHYMNYCWQSSEGQWFKEIQDIKGLIADEYPVTDFVEEQYDGMYMLKKKDEDLFGGLGRQKSAKKNKREKRKTSVSSLCSLSSNCCCCNIGNNLIQC